MSRTLGRRLLAISLAAIVLNAAAGTAAASFTQEPGSPVDVGLHPAIALTADFNADGRPDVLSVEESTVSVLLRRATGGYELEAGSPKTVGGGPSGAAIADFNGDGRLDVAVSLFADPARTVVVLLRQPGGGFVEGLGTPIDLDFQAGAIAAGDFAGDAAPDLAVTNWNSPFGVRILRQEAGAFVLQPTALPTEGNPRALAVANFDGAGGSDLAVTNNASGSVTIVLRQGAGFTEETGSPVTVGNLPQQLVARDFDADGRPDLAVANSGDDTVSLLLRLPGGGFAHAPSSLAVGEAPVGIASGDFNSDGRLDLVTANQAGSTASVLLQTATDWAPDPSSPVATDTGATGVAVADADADGRPDLAVANYTDSSVSILLNTTPFPAPPPPPNLDVDGDGVQRPLDCDDNNAGIHPGAIDVAGDGVDQNCDGKDATLPVLERGLSYSYSAFRGGYVKLTSLSVKPVRAGDNVRFTCRGRGCQKRRKTINVGKDKGKLSLLRYVKRAKLHRGAVIKVRVTRPATIGAFFSLKFRGTKKPVKRERCLQPGSTTPTRCPAA